MPTTPSLRSRVLLIDVLKAGAAQLILWHHFAWYGLFGEPAAWPLATTDDWLEDYGRYAVAVFMVTSGFLAAQTLPFQGLSAHERPLCLIRDRYLRLVGPFAVALVLAVLSQRLARQWLGLHEVLGEPVTLGQFLAHLFLLHGLLEVESLSAGVWYVAVDFQLYALFVLLLWAGRGLGRRASADFPLPLAPICVLIAALASLLYFNRDPRWDDTALYFFGTYALGIASGWAIRSGKRPRYRLLILGGSLLALIVEWRARLVVAMLTALLLGFGRLILVRREVRLVHYLGRTSYALFLVHYPVYLVVAAAFHQAGLASAGLGWLGLAFSWLASMLVADLFHRHVEMPLDRWRKRRRRCAAHSRVAEISAARA